MRNLKKVLTLVLTLAMLLSVMVVGAGAAFSDQDSIKNTEAVNTCNALNIINGENGSFYPTRNVTRAEMCKMICVALNGGREPALATGIGSTFTDTVGHWASPYIEYCVREGVVGGIGGGLFDPNGAVTGTQAAKMLLVAMGYDAGRQGYVGSNSWELNINSDAAKKGLYDGLESIDASAPLNRDNAAQIIYNAVDAPMVEYVFSAQTVNGSLTMVPTLKDRTKLVSDGTTTVERFCTILLDKYEVYSNYGQLVDIAGGKLTIKADPDYTTQSSGSRVTFTKVGTDYSDYLGQTVKVLYKTSDNVMGLAPVDGNKTYTVARSDVEAKGDKVKFGGTEYKIEAMTVSGSGSTATKSNYPNVIDTLTIGNTSEQITAVYGTANASSLAYGTTNFDTITFVDNDNDGTLEYAVITDVATGKVTYTNSDEVMVNGNSYDRDENEIASGVAKDEYVTITYSPFAEQHVINVIAKGTGKLSVNNDNECMFNDTWYKVGNTGLLVSNAGTNYDYWAYNGVLVDVDNAKNDASIDNLVMLLKLTDGTLSDQARLLYADGTRKDVSLLADIDDDDDDYVDFDNLAEGSLYLAIETKDGWGLEEIKAESAPGANDAVNEEIGDYTFHNSSANDVSNGSSGKIETVGSIPIPDSAVVFVYGGGGTTVAANTGKVLTGKELKNQATTDAVNKIASQSKGFFTSTVNGLNRASIIAVTLKNNSTELPSGGVIGDNYGLIVGNCKDNGSTISYTVWTGTENKNVTEDRNNLTDRTQYTVIAYDTIDANGNIEGVDKISPVVTAGLWSVDSDKIWTSNSQDYKLTSDTVYMCYDSNTSTVTEIGKVGGKDDLKAADYAVGTKGERINNVKYYLDSNGSDVAFILIDVNNRIKDESVAVTASIASISDYSTNATAVLSPTSGVKYGDVLELNVTIPDGDTSVAGTITLTGAVNAADGSNTITLNAVNNASGGSDVTLDTIYVVVTGNTVSGSFAT